MEPITPIAISEESYERIRNAIFEGVFKPGQRLDVGRIAKEFGISKQPVKDAINRLELEGLVTIKPRSGSFVRSINKKDIHNILQVRLMIETFAVANIEKDKLKTTLPAMADCIANMEEILKNSPFEFLKYNECDIAFHEQIVSLANNPELIRSYRLLHSHYLTAWGYYSKAYSRAIVADKEHGDIFNSLVERDFQTAQAIVQSHIQTAEAGLENLWNETKLD